MNGEELQILDVEMKRKRITLVADFMQVCHNKKNAKAQLYLTMSTLI